MQILTLYAELKTLNWYNDNLVDWSKAGECYNLEGGKKNLTKYSFIYRFNRSIVSSCGTYVLIFERLGTKALLLRNGELLREINRSYYVADAFEFPAAFFDFNGRTYLAHCPQSYCQIDFEDVETGELITNLPNRQSDDFFHSRLEISPGGKYLMSKGWIWHPVDNSVIFNIADCFANPYLLDTNDNRLWDNGTEICTASFIDDERVLVGSSDELFNEDEIPAMPLNSFAIWQPQSNTIINPITPQYEFGNLLVIDDTYCWDTYKYPKVINYHTGEIVDKAEAVCTGKQRGAIFSSLENSPVFEIHSSRKKLAVLYRDKVIVLTANI